MTHEILTENPFNKLHIRIQSPKQLPRVIPIHIVHNLLKSAYEAYEPGHREVLRDIMVLELLFSTGLRVSELCALSSDTFLLSENELWLLVNGKGRKERILQVSTPELVRLSHTYCHEFADEMHNQSARASLWKWLKGICTKDLSGQYDKWYFFSDSPPRREAYQQYIREIAQAVGSFLRKYDYFPVLFGMERLDAKACHALMEQLPCPGAMFLSGDCPADMMTGVLRRLSLLVTSRYHAAVLSMEKGCPIVAVSMDERLDGIMRELSLDQKYLLHVTDNAKNSTAPWWTPALIRIPFTGVYSPNWRNTETGWRIWARF